jgi:DNA-binding LacI/PurR family transcriptional regulator
LAIQHLVEIGRKRIGFVGFDYPMPLNIARYQAYRAALRAAGLQANSRWVARLSMSLPPDEIAAQYGTAAPDGVRLLSLIHVDHAGKG